MEMVAQLFEYSKIFGFCTLNKVNYMEYEVYSIKLLY